MTTQKTQDYMRIGIMVVQVLIVPGVIWIASAVTDIKSRVAVIESNVSRLTSLHEVFAQHERDNGIHQTPEVKRAVTYELVDKKIDAAISRIETKLDALQSELPPEWFRNYVEDLKRRVDALEKRSE